MFVFNEEANKLNRDSKVNSHSGVVRKSVFSEQGYSQYLCFNVIVGSNDLCVEQKYTEEQQRNHDLIKPLHDGGMGYRKISHYLNDKVITTSKGNRWKNTQVYSVLKRYKERQERLGFIEKEYEPVWGKMEVRWERN